MNQLLDNARHYLNGYVWKRAIENPVAVRSA
jgi:hypothetical protein